MRAICAKQDKKQSFCLISLCLMKQIENNVKHVSIELFTYNNED